MSDPESYRQGGERIAAMRAEISAIEQELVTLFDRWAELDEIHSS
jgi:hypothetical protein